MVGGALALGLAQQGFTVMVIEHAAPAPFVADSQPDVRISAISAASVALLKGLGVWEAVQGMRSHPYRRLETWEWENAHVVFDAAELKLPLLGYMVENNVLQQALWQALEAHPGVTLRVPASLAALQRRHDGYALELADGECITPKLVIGADGANSQVRQMAELAFMPGNMRSRVCLSPSSVKMRQATAPGSSLRQRGRAPFCRCSMIGRRWCGMTLRHVFASCRVYR